jgi:hypothetical protein
MPAHRQMLTVCTGRPASSDCPAGYNQNVNDSGPHRTRETQMAHRPTMVDLEEAIEDAEGALRAAQVALAKLRPDLSEDEVERIKIKIAGYQAQIAELNRLTGR